MRLLPALTLSLVFLQSCSTNQSPILYPNHKLSVTPKLESQEDIRICKDLAEEYVRDPQRWKDVAQETAVGGVAGAAAGAVAGTIFSNAGRGTAAGAASGAVIGLIRSLIRAGEPNPTKQRFVEACLTERGYRVIGWE